MGQSHINYQMDGREEQVVKGGDYSEYESDEKYVEKFQMLVKMEEYYDREMYKKLGSGEYNVFSIINNLDSDRKRFTPILKKMQQDNNFDPSLFQLNEQESRAVACFLGLAICDALGASTEFIPFVKNRRNLIANDFEDVKSQIKKGVLDTRSGKIGVWTDDCSMAIAMADSLLLNNFKFDPIHMRYMFNMWLEHGLGNGGRRHSIGLGGNISISMREFFEEKAAYARQGDRFNNGNGSLMRLAPVPICFSKNIEEATKYSGLQSKTTHNGDEASECSRLLAAILVNLIHRKKTDEWRDVIENTCSSFQTEIKTVKCLALSKQEPEQLYKEQEEKYGKKFLMFNKNLVDRNWNWKDAEFTYSPCRFKSMPGYIGSYCMDNLSMALHTVWHNKSFKEIALVNANMGGDCDTVGAVAGQIAGAIYGIDPEMLKLYSQMDDFKSGRYDVFLKGFKLYNQSPLQHAPFLQKEQ